MTIDPSKLFISLDQRLLDRDWVCDRLTKTYWGEWLQRGQILEAIDHSVCFGAYLTTPDGRQQVGFLRVVTDYATFSSIMDVFVEPAYRKQGIGTQLLQTALASHACKTTINILSTRDAKPFYLKHGYIPVQAMSRDPDSKWNRSNK